MGLLLQFIKDSYGEFKDKVEWPKWLDLQSSTIVVTVSTVLLSLFTFGVDELFSKTIQNLIVQLAGILN